MSRKREWSFYIRDMLRFAGNVLIYTDDLDYNGFSARGLTYDATLRNLELIGEAATHIPEEICQLHDEIPWRLVVAVRNRLIHGYLGIDDETVWSIVTDDIPDLVVSLNAIVQLGDDG